MATPHGEKRPRDADEFAAGVIERVKRKRMAPKDSEEVFPVTSKRFGVGLLWDYVEGKAIDLDLQAVAIDTSGNVLDAVYYANLKACGNAMTHSGDEKSGATVGLDEKIWVDIDELPGQVKIIAFVVACHAGGSLKDVRNGKFRLLNDRIADCETAQPVAEQREYPLEQSDEKVDLICALIRDDGGWNFRLIDEPAQEGQHFLDLLATTLGDFVRKMVPGAPKRIKAAFQMEKGTVVDFPKSSVLNTINVGLGWDVDKGTVDLDVSAILLDKDSRQVGTPVYFKNLKRQGIFHSGDELEGELEGDDETITVEFENLEPEVQSVFFVVNIYSSGKTFADVAKPYCRVIAADSEYSRFDLANKAGDERGLVVARMFRQPCGVRFGIQAIGVPCKGATWRDAMPVVMEWAKKSPRDVTSELAP